MSLQRTATILSVTLALAASLASCKRSAEPATTDSSSPAQSAVPTVTAQVIAADGSSTVFPITEAVAEDFREKNKTPVTIGVSGTGGGFKKFCGKEVALAGASRPIKPSEVELCKASGVEYIELPVAYDGLAIVVNPKNDWAKDLTVAELKALWEPAAQGKIKTWSQVRRGWPEKEIHLFGPCVDSGTYDYFTAAVVGKEGRAVGEAAAAKRLLEVEQELAGLGHVHLCGLFEDAFDLGLEGAAAALGATF